MKKKMLVYKCNIYIVIGLTRAVNVCPLFHKSYCGGIRRRQSGGTTLEKLEFRYGLCLHNFKLLFYIYFFGLDGWLRFCNFLYHSSPWRILTAEYIYNSPKKGKQLPLCSMWCLLFMCIY